MKKTNFFTAKLGFKGFTLIELMIVVSIIAILTAIVLSSFSAAKAKSRDGKRISDIAQINLAIAGFFDRCGQYPSTLLLTANNNCPTGVNLGTFISAIPVPTAEAGESRYWYLVSNAYDDYFLATTLENTSSSANGGYTGTMGTSGTWTGTDGKGQSVAFPYQVTNKMYAVNSK